MSKSDFLEDLLKEFFLETSDSDHHEIFFQLDISDIRRFDEFSLEGESFLHFFDGLIAFQGIAPYNDDLVVSVPMFTHFHIIPQLIEEKERKKSEEASYKDDKSRYPKKEDKSLPEISDECDTDNPIYPDFAERLEIFLNRFIEFVKIL